MHGFDSENILLDFSVGFHTKIPHFSEIWPNIPIYLIIRNFALRANFDSIPIYLILGVRYTNIPHVFWKFQQYTNIPHAWFGRAKRAYQYTSCFRKMAKYTNIPQFNEYQETITSPLLYRYLPYIICAQCMNNVIWIFLVSTWNCRVKLIEILSVPAVPWYHTLLGYSTSRDWNLGVTRDWNLGVTHSTTV